MGLEVMFEEKDKKMGAKTFEDDLFSDVARVIPFGIPNLDIALGGGLYTGKIYEVMGWESSGKSTMALEASKAFSKYWLSQGDKNFLVLWIETESAMDKVRAIYMGCDLTNFLFFEAETVEAGFNIMDTWLKKCQKLRFHLLIIWDTIAAAPTESEIAEPVKKKAKDGEEGKETAAQYQGGLAEKARIIRYNLRKLTQPLAQTDSIMFIVNQLYHVPQQKKWQGGETERSPGGEGFHFHASVRMKTTKKEDIPKVAPDGQTYSEGIITEIFTQKNKLTLPKQKAIIILKGETGFDKFETAVRYLRTAKIIDMSGTWAVINLPTPTETKKGEIKIETQEVKFQNAKQLQEKAAEFTGLEDYLDYLIYQSYSTISPLIKVKIIKKLWAYEERFLGKRETVLTEREKEVATLLHKFNESQDNNREDNK